MTPQQLVGLGVRLFAVWLAISSIRYLSSVPLYLVSTIEIAEKVHQAYLVAAAYLVASLLLWFFPLTVAHKLIPRTQFNDNLKLHTASVARVGCALLGLWILAKSLPGVVGNFISLSLLQSSIREMPAHSQVDFGVYVFEVIFSLALIFKSRMFAQLILREADERER